MGMKGKDRGTGVGREFSVRVDNGWDGDVSDKKWLRKAKEMRNEVKDRGRGMGREFGGRVDKGWGAEVSSKKWCRGRDG